jgi:dienelactone hydrolase
MLPTLILALLSGAAPPPSAQVAVRAALAREVIGPRQALLDTQDHLEPRIPRLPIFKSAAEWQKHAEQLRKDLLDRVVFRGTPANWRGKVQVRWGETISAGAGYKIRKLRYEALPGLWVPALLYVPDKLSAKVPVALAVNGHDRAGKAAVYKQVRCINLARRGLLVLNVEWLGMGQLAGPGYAHYRMNQLDLCGASGLAPFYLCLSRALDVLLAQPNADPKRVAVSGLSGGGWQTIVLSSLDPRVILANPVAGYSSFRPRIRTHFKDLGDSEQTPTDLATLADYTHLTALRAPRPTLLTYNARDDCCFEAGYALPPLLAAARPLFKLYGKEANLRWHVNHDPGTHNYEKDNREAFYRMIGDHFFAGDRKRFPVEEVSCAGEIKSADDLAVDLPRGNADFNTLARGLAKSLPRVKPMPEAKRQARAWQAHLRKRLGEVVRYRALTAEATRAGQSRAAGVRAVFWKLRLGGAWSVPAVELSRGKPARTSLLIHDAGRRAAVTDALRLLDAGHRVLAVDPFYFGEAQLGKHDFLFALLVAATGDRPLGLQASQLAAVARWAQQRHGGGPVALVAAGPRLGLSALVAAALEEKAIGAVELHGPSGSLKEVIEENRGVNERPEVFSFGLLELLDVKQLVALAAPRPVTAVRPGGRVRAEWQGLPGWYTLLGREHDPLR